MKKFGQWMLLLVMIAVFCWYGTVLADRGYLRENLIRLHVVADSDSREDQQIKLQVRDAIVTKLQQIMADISDVDQAKEYLKTHLADLEETANQVLQSIGSTDVATVSFELEQFPKRVYDTFSLPSGIYEALRVTIGSGKGQNWWCVVFPQLCVPATSEGFEAAAVASGFSDDLVQTLSGEYELRFYLLDCLGQLENFFFAP